MQRAKHTLIRTSLLALALAGCGDDPTYELGDVATTGANLSDYAGDWDGYAEAYDFDDESDRVRLVLDAEGEGYLRVGEAATAPDPADVSRWPYDGKPNYQHGNPVAGAVYPVYGAIVEDRRIRLSIKHTDFFDPWCATLTPVEDADNPGLFGCQPTGMVWEDGGECFVDGVPTSCNTAFCDEVCTCDGQGCTAFNATERDIRIDGALSEDGNELVGTLDFGQRPTIRLMR